LFEIRHEGMDERSATQQAYAAIYRGDGILLRDSFYLWLVGLLKPQPGRQLLDISCGEGRLVVLAAGAGLDAIGLDFAIDGVLKGRGQAPASGWAVGDGECLPIVARSVDYVTHIGSLEHYLHPERGVQEISRVLKPEGKACILLPNAFGLLGNIRHVWSTGEIFDDGQPLQRYATHETWSTLLSRNGLRILKTIGYGEIERPRTAADWRWLLRRPRKILRLAISGFIPLNLSNHFVFLCTSA
jgi:ubiquinone/menaquinone biosynthesis C-methylase UbiE